MSPSITDVARVAGVSTATVSRALRGLPGLSERTRVHVMQVAKELDYRPSKVASSLASGRTQSIGLVVPSVARWFFATAIEGATTALREADYDAVLYSLPDSASDRPTFNPEILRNRVDGVLVISLPFSEEEAGGLRRLSVPATFVSVAQPGFHQVGIDDRGAAELAVDHLVSLGHSSIGHVAGRGGDVDLYSPTTARRAGWRSALVRAGLDSSATLEEPSELTIESGYKAARRLLSRHPEISAIFASSDEAAMGAIKAGEEGGLRLGHDLSVVGIDGHDLAEFAGLSTVAQPVLQQGYAAARLLLDLVDGRVSSEPQRLDFPVELICRTSTVDA